MADPINLNRARKAKARLEKTASAQENRVKHGRTGAEKAAARAEANLAAARLDAHRLKD